MRGAPSVARVAFYLPLIPAVVVAERLPESGLVAGLDPEAPNPLRAFPEVPTWNDEAGRAAVLRRERLGGVLPSPERLGVSGGAQRQGRGVGPLGGGEEKRPPGVQLPGPEGGGATPARPRHVAVCSLRP